LVIVKQSREKVLIWEEIDITAVTWGMVNTQGEDESIIE
jgi:hypothetical protein